MERFLLGEKIEMRRAEINSPQELIQMIDTAFGEVKENHDEILMAIDQYDYSYRNIYQNVSTTLTFCLQERTTFFVNMKNPWNESAFI